MSEGSLFVVSQNSNITTFVAFNSYCLSTIPHLSASCSFPRLRSIASRMQPSLLATMISTSLRKVLANLMTSTT